MKLQHIKKQLFTVALTTVAMGAMAQSLNSAYYTEDYKFRHDLNPAYGNDQNYISIPALGNISQRTYAHFSSHLGTKKKSGNPFGLPLFLCLSDLR